MFWSSSRDLENAACPKICNEQESLLGNQKTVQQKDGVSLS